MADSTSTNTNPIIYIICVIVAFTAIFYGTRTFADYNMMKKALAKVEFLEKNKAPQYEVCSAMNWALDVSKQVQNQKQYDALTQRIERDC